MLTALPSCEDRELVRRLEQLERGGLFASAPVARRGVYRVEMVEKGALTTHREEIVAFANRDLGVRLKDVNGLPPTDPERLVFVKDARRSLRFRDLYVDGVDRVLDNYQIELEPGLETVAGRPAFHLALHRRGDSLARIDVWGDDATGVALRVERRGSSGNVQYQMVYEQIEIGDLTRQAGDPERLPSPPKVEKPRELFPALEAAEGLGDALDGFVWADREFSELTIGGQRFQGCVDRFTDGLQHLFVVQGNPDHDFWVTPPPAAPRLQTTIYASRLANMNVLWTRKHGRSFAAYGPYPEQTLAAVLQSYQAEK